MGKIKQSDLDKLKEAGKLSASAEKAHMFHLVFTFVVVEDLNHQMR